VIISQGKTGQSQGRYQPVIGMFSLHPEDFNPLPNHTHRQAEKLEESQILYKFRSRKL